MSRYIEIYLKKAEYLKEIIKRLKSTPEPINTNQNQNNKNMTQPPLTWDMMQIRIN